jgi:hypothetical protein
MMAYAAEYGESLAIARPIEMAPYEAGLDTLVITSGDFGLAYLNGRRAARSVSELFRNYVVCLVDYSRLALVLKDERRERFSQSGQSLV